MQKNILILVLLLSYSFVFAQKNIQDTINDKLFQEVIESASDGLLKPEIENNNKESSSIFNIPGIEGIMECASINSEKKSADINHLANFQGGIEFGYGVGIGEYGINNLRINVISEYKFNPYFSMGLGLGARLYYEDPSCIGIPIFVHFMVRFLDAKVSPFLTSNIGYALNVFEYRNGNGFMFNPSVGVSIKSGDQSFINIGLGYELQMAAINTFYSSYDSELQNIGGLNLFVLFMF